MSVYLAPYRKGTRAVLPLHSTAHAYVLQTYDTRKYVCCLYLYNMYLMIV